MALPLTQLVGPRTLELPLTSVFFLCPISNPSVNAIAPYPELTASQDYQKPSAEYISVIAFTPPSQRPYILTFPLPL